MTRNKKIEICKINYNAIKKSYKHEQIMKIIFIILCLILFSLFLCLIYKENEKFLFKAGLILAILFIFLLAIIITSIIVDKKVLGIVKDSINNNDYDIILKDDNKYYTSIDNGLILFTYDGIVHNNVKIWDRKGKINMNTKTLKKEILKSIIKDALYLLIGFMIMDIFIYFVVKDILLPTMIVGFFVIFVILQSFLLYNDEIDEIDTRLYIKELIDKDIPLDIQLCPDNFNQCIEIKHFAIDYYGELKLRIDTLYDYGTELSIIMKPIDKDNKKIEIDNDLNIYVYLKIW